MYVPFSIDPELTEPVGRNNWIFASTSMSLCFTAHWRVLIEVVLSIFSCSGNICSRMPLSIACSIIWNRAYLYF